MTTTLQRPAVIPAPTPPLPASTPPPTRSAPAPQIDPDDSSARPPHAPMAHDGVMRLALRGALTDEDRSSLMSRLDDLVATGARTLHLDLSAVTHVEGGVARLLLSTSWRLEHEHRSLVLIRVQPHVRRMIKWYGAGHLLARLSRAAAPTRSGSRKR